MTCSPATSVNLWYTLPHRPSKFREAKTVKLGNSVTVERVHNQTYYCVIQFCPAGYCGIQQREAETDRIAIFSVWHGEENQLVELVEKGKNVVVSPFANEGEGLKSIRPLEWQLGEKVSFEVTVTKSEPGVYLIRGDVLFREKRLHLATFRRRGKHPTAEGFACFVEDYNRVPKANGGLHRRCACFSDAWCRVDDEPISPISSCKFNKTTDGLDAINGSRCSAEKCEDQKSTVRLFTGGEEVEEEKRCKPNTEICVEPTDISDIDFLPATRSEESILSPPSKKKKPSHVCCSCVAKQEDSA